MNVPGTNRQGTNSPQTAMSHRMQTAHVEE